ncbi:MAG: 4-phosphopantoate--beta-alanine ligase [Methanomassiliicoccales archaeon PtaU1.Bin124]|nr:MAG: 4-phosphopantoate--beta-alanine ligase [Methanomassiliicoccales archaeon PtaU1.Bin124]
MVKTFMVSKCIGRNVEISKDHPRYRSLVIRERMGELMERGVVARTGLIAHGRGEAFDYLIGERTIPCAARAEEAAAAALLEAKRPVITINGNAAALAAKELVDLAILAGAKVEVNLFHRTDERVERVCNYVEEVSGAKVLGRDPDAILPGIASDRAKCCSEGIFTADLVLIPLEDGDRAEALVKAGKKVIAIDLNPLSRTAVVAHISIVDEVTRAVPNIITHAARLKNDKNARRAILKSYDNHAALQGARDAICAHMSEGAK